MAEPCAVAGVGQTHHKKRRDDVSMVGLVREAAERALEDAGCDWSGIDALVIGKAPDAFEGIIQPELFLADALGGAGKPMLRVHTAGSVGGSTFIAASHLIQSGVHERVLALAWEKQSEGDAQWGLSSGQSGGAGAGGTFAPWVRQYIRDSAAPDYIGWMVAVKDRLNALKNPYAHLKLPDITIDKVKESAMLWEPIRFLESCPSSDGAAAAVLTTERGAAQSPKTARMGCRHGHAERAEPVPRTRRGEATGRGRMCPRRIQPGRHHESGQGHRCRRALRSVQLVRAHVARGPRDRRTRAGLDDG